MSLVFVDASGAVSREFGVVVMIATINGVLIDTIMASRVLYGLADRGHLPAKLAQLAPRKKPPAVATLVAVIIVLTQTLPTSIMAERTSPIVFVFVLVNLSLIRPKSKLQPTGGIFQVPYFVPIPGLVASPLLRAVGSSQKTNLSKTAKAALHQLDGHIAMPVRP